MARVAVAAATLGLAMMAGCEKPTPPPSQADSGAGTNQPVEQSKISETVGTMLQYDTLRAGARMQDKARKAVSAHNERARDATPEDQ
ncbi:MAG: hypothetical protein WCL44_04260 [bacterium]